MYREYIVEMTKVNGAIAGAIAFVNTQNVIEWNEVAQAILTTIALLLAVVYSLYKTIQVRRAVHWAEEDRLAKKNLELDNENSEET